MERASALCLFVTCCSLLAHGLLESRLLAVSPNATSVKIYPLPQGEAAAAISITAGGQPLPVSKLLCVRLSL